jgi:arsenate reductase
MAKAVSRPIGSLLDHVIKMSLDFHYSRIVELNPAGALNMNILFLCTGNSRRSILGEATFNHLAPAGWQAMSAGSQPDLPATPDIVITVCSSAAGETCPAYLGPVLRTHWGVDEAAFMTAYRILRARIEALLALPLDQLQADPARMKTELDRIGTLFANPAVTLARSASDTFAGIRPGDAPGFIAAQTLGALAATLLFCWLYPAPREGDGLN